MPRSYAHVCVVEYKHGPLEDGMGDRYTADVKCPYCNQENEEIYYAPSSGFKSARCGFCGKRFGLEFAIIGVPIESLADTIVRDKY